MEKTVSEAIEYRRSTRIYSDTPIDIDKVKQCLVNASLAPNSSNLQLWEFYHIVSRETIDKLAVACIDQNAAKTSQNLVVVVTRKDLWKDRARANINYYKRIYNKEESSEKDKKSMKKIADYYGKLIPILYFDVMGIFGILKYIILQILGVFRPVYRQSRLSDMRIVAHKSAALAAENFMISMAAIGYDTCPMEGLDSLMVRRILNLPRGAEINMVIGCGVRDEKGIYGPRFRVPFEEVYRVV